MKKQKFLGIIVIIALVLNFLNNPLGQVIFTVLGVIILGIILKPIISIIIKKIRYKSK